MVFLFRLLYIGAAFLSIAAGGLVIASLFIAARAPQSIAFLGISLAVGAAFLSVGALLTGIQRQVAGIATVARRHDDPTARELAPHLNRLLAYLLAGGAFACAVLGVMAYAILARIEQGFAVFG